MTKTGKDVNANGTATTKYAEMVLAVRAWLAEQFPAGSDEAGEELNLICVSNFTLIGAGSDLANFHAVTESDGPHDDRRPGTYAANGCRRSACVYCHGEPLADKGG